MRVARLINVYVMAKKKKKYEVVSHVLDNDCKTCVRNVMAQSPLIQDLYGAKRYTLVSVKGSIPYLLNMTDIIEQGIAKAFGEASDENQKIVFSEYFSDIKTILSMFKRMEDGTIYTD